MVKFINRTIVIFFLLQIASVANFFAANAVNPSDVDSPGRCPPCGQQNNPSEKALLEALKYGTAEQVKNILDKNKIDVNKKIYYWRPGLGCGRCEYAPLVAIVMDSRLSRFYYKKVSGYSYRNDNIVEEVREATEIINLLLSRGTDPNVTYQNEPILARAVQFKYEEVIKALLSKGADPNAKNRYGLAVMWSIQESSDYPGNSFFNNRTTDVSRRIYNIIEMLLSNGAAVDAMDNTGRTMLMSAAEHCDKNMVKLLISKGANVNAKYPRNKSLLGWLESCSVCPEVKMLLMGESVELDVDDLRKTFYNCNIEAAKTLLPKIKDINAKDPYGRTVLFSVILSSCQRKKDMAALLLSYGADINVKDKFGRTVLLCAIMQAEQKPDRELIELLLDNGADPNAKDKSGNTPLRIAETQHLKEITDLLRSGGAVDTGDRYDEIVSKYSAAIKLNPDDINAYRGRGFAYYSRGYFNKIIYYYDKAISDYSKVIKLSSENVKSYDYSGRGVVYAQKGEDDLAIADYTKALEIDPGNIEAYSNRALTYYRKGEYDKAWEDVHKAESLGVKIGSKFLEDLKKASGRDK
ncbi:MAG: ankyrin repeat domain-containing protein [Candidatus Omnitrophota bacterium]